MEDLYPLKMQPVFKEYAWGGKAIQTQYKKNTPYAKTAESWEVSVHPQGTSLVMNGVHAGVSLDKMSDLWGEALCGTLHEGSNFPLTFKLVDTAAQTPLQVHPDDVSAAENSGNGKTEMCYVLRAKSDAQIIYGFSEDMTEEKLERMLREKCFEETVNKVAVEEGDVLFIPGGVVHAVGKGVTLAEIQQTAGMTYALEDTDCAVEEILKISEPESSAGKEKTVSLPIEEEEWTRYKLCCCRYFGAEKAEVNGAIQEEADGRSFQILFFADGDGILRWNGGEAEAETGDTFLIPAALGNYEIEGKCEYLKYFIPEFAKDFLEPLLEAGYAEDEVISLLY